MQQLRGSAGLFCAPQLRETARLVKIAAHHFFA
jgi:hypothetical protein